MSSATTPDPILCNFFIVLSRLYFCRVWYALREAARDHKNSRDCRKLLLGRAQTWRHNKNPPQTLFERYCFLRAKSGANSAAKAGVFISLCQPFFIQDNGVGGAPLHTGAAAGAGFGVDHGQAVGGIDQGQGTVSPKVERITAIFAAITDAGLRAGFAGTRMKRLVN